MNVSVPKLVALGLLSSDDRHGYEMEEEIRQTNMRMWAKIGGSSLYKALSDLEEEGCLVSRADTALRGPGKHVFSITRYGRRKLKLLIDEALSSHSSVYSLRITGLAFALRLGNENAGGVEKSLEGLRLGLRELGVQKRRAKDSVSASILLDYYKDIYKAEVRAMERVLEHLSAAKSKVVS